MLKTSLAGKRLSHPLSPYSLLSLFSLSVLSPSLLSHTHTHAHTLTDSKKGRIERYVSSLSHRCCTSSDTSSLMVPLGTS